MLMIFTCAMMSSEISGRAAVVDAIVTETLHQWTTTCTGDHTPQEDMWVVSEIPHTSTLTTASHLNNQPHGWSADSDGR